jgi:hypothetical protein
LVLVGLASGKFFRGLFLIKKNRKNSSFFFSSLSLLVRNCPKTGKTTLLET